MPWDLQLGAWDVTMDTIAFYIFAAIAILASLGVIGQGNPMHSVMLLIVSFGALAGLYILLQAPFTAVTQIIIYAGAIMVLFLFVVMLLNAPQEDTEMDERRHLIVRKGAMKFGGWLAVALVGELVWALTRSSESGAFPGGAIDSVAAIGRSLFTDYAFAFEVTSVLILVAMLGAVVLAHRDRRAGAARTAVAPVGPVVPVVNVRVEKP